MASVHAQRPRKDGTVPYKLTWRDNGKQKNWGMSLLCRAIGHRWDYRPFMRYWLCKTCHTTRG